MRFCYFLKLQALFHLLQFALKEHQNLQQVNLFIQEEKPAETEAKGKTNSGSSKADKEKGMPAAKQEALNIATS